jgi:hypothetical protein
MTAPLTESRRIERIEIKLRTVSQLFHTLDPSPFREKDLADEAADYIIDQAEELPHNAQIDVILHVPADELPQSSAFDIASAIKDYFDLRSHNASREMRELFRTGRLSLLIGLIVLSICLLLGWLFAERLDEGPLSDILRESFLIFGWVAIWKPSEIFLYSWPPLARRRKLFRRLSQVNVKVEGDPSG